MVSTGILRNDCMLFAAGIHSVSKTLRQIELAGFWRHFPLKL